VNAASDVEKKFGASDFVVYVVASVADGDTHGPLALAGSAHEHRHVAMLRIACDPRNVHRLHWRTSRPMTRLIAFDRF
jgi:hypothetical protein